jgi:hypothetical protein
VVGIAAIVLKAWWPLGSRAGVGDAVIWTALADTWIHDQL